MSPPAALHCMLSVVHGHYSERAHTRTQRTGQQGTGEACHAAETALIVPYWTSYSSYGPIMSYSATARKGKVLTCVVVGNASRDEEG